jgi:chromosomal replication initiation ATPase DnaA
MRTAAYRVAHDSVSAVRAKVSSEQVTAPDWMLAATRRIRGVLEAVGDEFVIDPIDIMAGGCGADVAEARHAAFWILQQTTNLSHRNIADRLGRRDHTTVGHGLAVVEERRGRDLLFKKQTDAALAKVMRSRDDTAKGDLIVYLPSRIQTHKK